MIEHNFGVRYLIKPNFTRRRTNLGSYTFYTHTNEFVMDLICYNHLAKKKYVIIRFIFPH